VEVTVSKQVVLKLIRELLENNNEKNEPAVVTEPPVQELPVSQNPEIEGGPFELPPIEDEAYLPGTPVELAQACYAVGKAIPSQDVHRFWKALDRLVVDSETWQEEEDMSNNMVEERLRRQIRQILREAGMSDAVEGEEAPKMSKARRLELIRTAARKEKANMQNLAQQGRDEKKRRAHYADQEGEFAAGADDYLEPGETEADFDAISYEDEVGSDPRRAKAVARDSGGIDYFGEEPTATSWDSPDPRFKTKQQRKEEERLANADREELQAAERERVAAMKPGERGRIGSWEEIADIFSFKSPSGAKQMVDDPGRLMDKVRFLFGVDGSDPDALENLKQSAVKEYADELESSGALSTEDADYLKSNPEHTANLESYRVFLKKYIKRAMRKDPDSQAHVTKRKEDKAAARAAKKARKSGKQLSQFR